jgi:hypothetical protein
MKKPREWSLEEFVRWCYDEADAMNYTDTPEGMPRLIFSEVIQPITAAYDAVLKERSELVRERDVWERNFEELNSANIADVLKIERLTAELSAARADGNALAQIHAKLDCEHFNLKKERGALKAENARLTAELSEAKAEAIACLALISGMDETMDELKAERDAYALAMAHALRHGIYANKQAVKDELEKILKDVKR